MIVAMNVLLSIKIRRCAPVEYRATQTRYNVTNY